MACRVGPDQLAKEGDVVDVTPGVARMLVGSNKGVIIEEEVDAVPGTLTSREPVVENQAPKGRRAAGRRGR